MPREFFPPRISLAKYFPKIVSPVQQRGIASFTLSLPCSVFIEVDPREQFSMTFAAYVGLYAEPDPGDGERCCQQIFRARA